MNFKKLFSIKILLPVLGALLLISGAVSWIGYIVHEEFVSYDDLGIKESQYRYVNVAWIAEPDMVERAVLFGSDIPLYAKGFFKDRKYESKLGTLGVMAGKATEGHCPRYLSFKKEGDGVRYRLIKKEMAVFSKSEVESCLRKMMYLINFEHQKAMAKADMEKRQKENEEQAKKSNLESWNT